MPIHERPHTILRSRRFAPTRILMQAETKARKDIERTAEAIRSADRVALARAITLIESAKPEDQTRAGALLERLLPHDRQVPSASASAARLAPANRP